MAKGGLLTGKAPVNALMGEAGPEIVTPLNDETFIKFGEGFIDAAKRHKSEYSKILAAGNASILIRNHGGKVLYLDLRTCCQK